jgi:hypothetical protein
MKEIVPANALNENSRTKVRSRKMPRDIILKHRATSIRSDQELLMAELRPVKMTRTAKVVMLRNRDVEELLPESFGVAIGRIWPTESERQIETPGENGSGTRLRASLFDSQNHLWKAQVVLGQQRSQGTARQRTDNPDPQLANLARLCKCHSIDCEPACKIDPVAGRIGVQN